MTTTIDFPSSVTAKNVFAVSINPEDLYEARSILRHSSNRKASPSTVINISEKILNETTGHVIFEVVGADGSNPLNVNVSSGNCTLRVHSGRVIVHTDNNAIVNVVNKDNSSLIFSFDA